MSIMTLHGAKGLEFEIVFLPGWEEGLFPHQRSLDDNGRAGLEEERRLAYVGLTRARRQAKIYFAANRRVRGLWQTSLPSRFISELPEEHVALEDLASSSGFGEYAASRFDASGGAFGSRYDTPGWRRAEESSRSDRRSGRGNGASTSERTPNASRRERPSSDLPIGPGVRVFHQKFGPGKRRSRRRAETDNRFRPGWPEARHGKLCHARRARRIPSVSQSILRPIGRACLGCDAPCPVSVPIGVSAFIVATGTNRAAGSMRWPCGCAILASEPRVTGI